MIPQIGRSFIDQFKSAPEMYCRGFAGKGRPSTEIPSARCGSSWALMRSPDWHVERFHGDGDSIVVTAYRVLPNGRRALEPATFEFNDPVLAWLPFGIVIGLFLALLAGIFPFFRTAIDFLSNPFRFYALQWIDETAEGKSPFLEHEPAPWFAIIAWNLMGALLWFVGIPDLIDKGHTFLVWLIVLMTLPGVIMLIERLTGLFAGTEPPPQPPPERAAG